eukprot:364798-Chlamydomonas_euryale.AAC.19
MHPEPKRGAPPGAGGPSRQQSMACRSRNQSAAAAAPSACTSALLLFSQAGVNVFLPGWCERLSSEAGVSTSAARPLPAAAVSMALWRSPFSFVYPKSSITPTACRALASSCC